MAATKNKLPRTGPCWDLRKLPRPFTSVRWRHQAFTTGIIGALLILANLSLVAFLVFALNAKASAESRLIELASIDPLTGLLNRREFAVRFDSEWEGSARRASDKPSDH